MRLVGISTDDRPHLRLVWNQVVHGQFMLLGDPGARIIRTYGLVHPQGGLSDEDIALDASILVDKDGRERWRRVSATLPDIPTAKEILARIRRTRPMAKPGS